MDMLLIVHIQCLNNMTIQSILMMENHRRHEGLDVFTSSGRAAQSAWLGPERREAPGKRGVWPKISWSIFQKKCHDQVSWKVLIQSFLGI